MSRPQVATPRAAVAIQRVVAQLVVVTPRAAGHRLAVCAHAIHPGHVTSILEPADSVPATQNAEILRSARATERGRATVTQLATSAAVTRNVSKRAACLKMGSRNSPATVIRHTAATRTPAVATAGATQSAVPDVIHSGIPMTGLRRLLRCLDFLAGLLCQNVGVVRRDFGICGAPASPRTRCLDCA